MALKTSFRKNREQLLSAHFLIGMTQTNRGGLRIAHLILRAMGSFSEVTIGPLSQLNASNWTLADQSVPLIADTATIVLR